MYAHISIAFVGRHGRNIKIKGIAFPFKELMIDLGETLVYVFIEIKNPPHPSSGELLFILQSLG